MPGRRTTKTTAARRFRKRTGLRIKKTIPVSGAAMYKIARQVKGLIRKERRNHQYLNFVDKGAFLTVNADYQNVNLCNYQSLVATGPIFGSSLQDCQGNQMIHKSIGIRCYVDLENINGINEEGTVHFSAFLVSLKDAANNGSMFNPGSGALNMIPNVDYVMSSVGAGLTGGMAMLNKKKFVIHRKKFFTLSNREQSLGIAASATQYGTNMEWYWKIKPNTFIKNPQGDWASLQTALDPSKQYYLILFNDNSLTDTEAPQWQYSVVHTIQTLGQ